MTQADFLPNLMDQVWPASTSLVKDWTASSSIKKETDKNPNTDANANTDSNPNTDRNANTHTHTNANTDTNANANANTNINTYMFKEKHN